MKRKVHISLNGYSYFCHDENSIQELKKLYLTHEK